MTLPTLGGVRGEIRYDLAACRELREKVGVRHDLVIHKPHFVYRAFDAEGTLLYVGRTYRPWVRIDQHRTTASPWFPLATRIDWEFVGDYEDAKAAEAAAIADEHPAYNVNGRSVTGAARGVSQRQAS